MGLPSSFAFVAAATTISLHIIQLVQGENLEYHNKCTLLMEIEVDIPG